jgi:UrcA family protein
MKTTSRSVLALSTLLASLGWSAATLAAPTRVGEVATKVVRFKDLDLSTAEGAKALYERITTAARIVCRDAGYDARECRARAVDDAVRRVGRPLLSSVHSSSVERVEEVVLR